MQTIVRADARKAPLRDGCAQLVVTSPPCHGQRDYEAGDGKIGSEAHVEAWRWSLVEVGEEAYRVLGDGGAFVGHVVMDSEAKSHRSRPTTESQDV